MEKYQEIEGNLISLALDAKFDVITHGCNCFCTMGSGIAVPMAKTFGADKFPLEDPKYKGDRNKLGQIDYEMRMISAIDKKVMTVLEGSDRYTSGKGSIEDHTLIIINSYTQYNYGQKFGPPLDYNALTLCLSKINAEFPGSKIGLPLIGCGLAGGDWNKVQEIIKTELNHMYVTIVKLPS